VNVEEEDEKEHEISGKRALWEGRFWSEQIETRHRLTRWARFSRR
jgi:hypothetical protein